MKEKTKILNNNKKIINRKTKPRPLIISKRKALQILENIFLRNGYLRVRNESKLELNSSKNYKKGFEIRFIPIDLEELEMIRTSISKLGFTVSNTFIKHGHIVQPLYGKKITLEFLKLKEEEKIYYDNLYATRHELPAKLP